MKKRVTAVILTAALAVASLAGCGNTATSEPAAEATGSTVTAATEAAESTSTEDKTITVAARLHLMQRFWNRQSLFLQSRDGIFR